MARPTPTGPPAPRRLLDWVLTLAIAQLAFVAFLPALGADWVLWDDDKNFQQNLHYRGLGPAQLRWMLTTPIKGQYVPVTWLTLGFDHVLWGMNPAGYGDRPLPQGARPEPEYPDAWHNAGVVLEKTGRKAEAQPYYARARALGLTR